MSEPIIAIGFATLSAAFSLIWWEVRQLRRARHSNAQLLQWIVLCISVLAKKVEVHLPPPMRGDE